MSSSETRNRKKKNIYTEEDLKKALSEVRDNKKSIRQISKEYGIPKTTILDKISGRRPDGVKKPGPEPVLGVDGEKRIIEWLLNISKCGFPVKKQELLDTVQKIIRDGQFKNRFKDDRPGQKWFEKFLARNKEISLKNSEGINRARAQVTEQSIRLWFKELEQYLDSINQKHILSDPKRIFNGDESGFALCPKTGKVLGPRGYKNLYQIKLSNEKENITVLLTFNANGDVCPPCVVFPYIRPPKAVVNSMPQEWCLGRSDTGWMRGDVFFEYVTNDFNNWIVRNNITKPVLLLVDGHKSHMSLMLSTMCEDLQIILYALPPNTTHILQPADVSVFAPLKAYWKSTVREFLLKPENLNCAVTKTNFCTLLNEAIKHPNMPDNIKNGFRRCGLYPFDANSPDYTKCVRNTLENVQSTGPTHNINHSDIKTFKKVLKYLRPALKEKNINVRTIMKEVNILKKSLPMEVGIAEISIETESENSMIDLSNTDQNKTHFAPIDCELDATKEINISSSHGEEIDQNTEDNNSGLTVQIQTVSAQIHPSPKKYAEPDTLKLSTRNRNAALASITDYDEITVLSETSQKDSDLVDCNKNISLIEDLSIIEAEEKDTISTLHLSGSYLDVSSIVSIDDFLILPFEDEEVTTTTLSVAQKKPLSKEQMTESPATSSIHTALTVLPKSPSQSQIKENAPTSLSTSTSAASKVLPTETPHDLQPLTSPILRKLPQQNILDPFKTHLMLPEIPDKKRKTGQRTPAAISSTAWRKYYEDKEQIKNEKQEAIRKRKIERIKKQEQQKALKKSQNVRKTAPKRKKTTQPVHTIQETDTLDSEYQKENIPAVDKTQCAECDDVLISDTEDDNEKNIGCDKCVRWYHLKCTKFAGLSYLLVKDKYFECNLCD